MFRNLFILAAIVIIVLIVRNFLSQSRRSKPAVKNQNTVQCAHCGAYLPQDAAIQQNGHYFCNTQHSLEWQQSHHD